MKYALSQLSNWKYIVACFVLFAVFSFYLFPEYQERLSEAAGEQVKPLDTRFSYSADEVRVLFEQLGTEGRDIYKGVVGLDMVYPLVYGFLFILILAWFLKKITGPGSQWLMLALLPLIGVLFDYLENINTLKLLNRYPEISIDAVAWGERMTLLKHGFGLLSVALAALLAVVYLVKTLMHRKKSSVISHR